MATTIKVVSTSDEMNLEPSPATTSSTSTPSGVATTTRSSTSTGRRLPIDRFIAEREGRWAELVELLDRRHRDAEAVLRLGEAYRATAADLARARQRWPGDPVVGELEALVGRARAEVYRSAGARASVRHWLTTGFYRRVRERPGLLAVAFLLLWGPSIGFALWAHHDPATARAVADVSSLSRRAADVDPTGGGTAASTADQASFSTTIFTNNIRVSILCLAGGMTGGLATAALLLYNGMIVGLVVGLLVAGGGGGYVLTHLAPHGLLEWSLVTVAGATGLRIGAALVAPGWRSRGEALVAEARAAAETVLGVALWLVPTGLIEGFVSTAGLPPAAALGVGLLAAGAFWGLVWWRGRPEAPVR